MWEEKKNEQPEFSEYQAGSSLSIEEEPNIKEYINQNKQK